MTPSLPCGPKPRTGVPGFCIFAADSLCQPSRGYGRITRDLVGFGQRNRATSSGQPDTAAQTRTCDHATILARGARLCRPPARRRQGRAGAHHRIPCEDGRRHRRWPHRGRPLRGCEQAAWVGGVGRVQAPRARPAVREVHAFEQGRKALETELSEPGSDTYIGDAAPRADALEDRDGYVAENVFWVTPGRWSSPLRPACEKSLSQGSPTVARRTVRRAR
jgi:hypothetical protein